MEQKFKNSIIIIGGGMNGLTLSLLLAQDDFNVTCIDAAPETINIKDIRTTAISYGSSRILKNASIWDEIIPRACPIHKIKILDGKSSTLLNFDTDENFDPSNIESNFEAFGWIVENKYLYQSLKSHCASHKNLNHIMGQSVTNITYNDTDAEITLNDGATITGNLIIGADGRQSFTRQAANITTKKWKYNQQAVICVATHENPHHNIAIEHFRRHGPFAILPMQDDNRGHHRSAVVWTIEGSQSKDVITNPESLLAAMNARFPDEYGAVMKVSATQLYPLNFNHAYDYVAHRTALIGDAAHGIHPIAGQGLNIGLQDVQALHKILVDLKNNHKDIGKVENLKQYEILRKPDNTAMAAATDMLNKLFSNNRPITKLLRRKGLKIIERSRGTKKFFINRAMGLNNTEK